MRIIARRKVQSFWARHTDAEEPLKAWFKLTREADWSSPQDVKNLYRNATILKDSRVVFNIAGNKYRLVVWINYAYRIVYIRFVGTHHDYDKVDVQTV